MEMVMLLMRELMLMLGADDQPTWGLLSLLSEPHDQPYPMQPYVTKPLQFHSVTNPDTIPYKFPTVGAGDGAMGRGMPCQGHRTTVQPYNGTMYNGYDVQCTTGTTYNVRRVQRTMYDGYNIRCTTTYDSTTWSYTLSKHAVSK